jgi:hypothetical protein
VFAYRLEKIYQQIDLKANIELVQMIEQSLASKASAGSQLEDAQSCIGAQFTAIKQEMAGEKHLSDNVRHHPLSKLHITSSKLLEDCFQQVVGRVFPHSRVVAVSVRPGA